MAGDHLSGTDKLGNVERVQQDLAAGSFKASDYVITEGGVAKVDTQKLDRDIRSKKVPLIRSGALNLEAKEYAKALNQAGAAQRESSLQGSTPRTLGASEVVPANVKGDSSGQPVNMDKITGNLGSATMSLADIAGKLSSTHKSLETIMHTMIGKIA